jgi:hypothetical protein
MCLIIQKNRVRLLIGGCAMSFLLAALGCGSSTATVSGKISFRNNPLHGGTVTFYGPGENGWTKTSTISDDGSYKLDHVPTGSARITVETKTAKVNPQAKQKMPKMPKDKPPEGLEHSPFGQMQKQSADKFVEIPEKYKDPNQSGLTYEIKNGKQEHNINLE